MKTPQPKLGKFIKERRQSLALSVPDLAKLLGLSIDSIYAYEAGYGHSKGSEMTAELKSKFSSALGCEVSEIESLLPMPRKKLGKIIPNNKLGRMLYFKRIKKNLSHEEIYLQLGIRSDCKYRHLESGRKQKMSRELAESLSDILEIPLKKLKPFIANKVVLANRHMSQSTSKLGTFIRSKRRSMGMSGQEFGDKLGITKASISLLELGKTSKPSRTFLIAISEVLNVKVKKLESLLE